MSSTFPATSMRTVSRCRASGTTPLTVAPAGELSHLRLFRDRAHQRPHAEQLLHLHFDLGLQRRIVAQEELGVLAALPDALIAVGIPGARLLDDVGLGGEIDQQRGVADPLVEQHVELGLLERRRHLVLHHLDPHPAADDDLALLDRTDAADVETERGVELERLATGGGLGVAEHDADLFAELVDEHHRGVGAIDGAGQLAERLAHEAGLEPDVAVAHVAFDFGLGHQRRDRIDDDDVDRAGADQDLDDLEALLPGVGL